MARIGRTPEDRARWLLRFADRDLTTLTPRKSKSTGWEFSAYIEAHLPRNRHVTFPVRGEALRESQAWLRDGLHALRTTGVWTFAVELPQGYILRLEPRSFYARTGLQTGFRPFKEVFTLESGVILADRLHFCPREGCARPFIRRKRQQYCSGACSQHARTARHRARHPGYSRDRYRKKVLEQRAGATGGTGRVRIQGRSPPELRNRRAQRPTAPSR